MNIKKIFKNAGARFFHGVDRAFYEYFSWKYLDAQNKPNNASNDLISSLDEGKISTEQSSVAANHFFDRMVSRSEEFPFLRAPQRKNSVVPAIR